MNYAKMEAGPEMDRLVAEQVMLWTLYHYDKGGPGDEYWSLLDEECNAVDSGAPIFQDEFESESAAFAWFQPSMGIGNAWQVVEELSNDGWWIDISNQPGRWDVAIRRSVDSEPHIGNAESASLAICRAALSAVMALKPEGV